MKDFEITAAEVSRNFGRWQDNAQHAPVHVTHHGRRRVVILSAEEYDRLSEQAGEAAPRPASAGADDEAALQAVMANLGQGFVALDDQLRVTAANPAAQACLGRSETALLGMRLPSANLGERAAVFEDRLHWVLRSGEPAAFEASSFMDGGAPLAVRAFPYRDGLGVLFSNIGELAALRGEHSRWRAEHRLLAEHEDVCLADLNILGFVLETNPTMRRFLGFTEAQLSNVRLSDLTSAIGRQHLMEALNRLLQFAVDTVTVELEFITREVGRKVLKVAICRRMRGEVCEGYSVLGLCAGGQAGVDTGLGGAAQRSCVRSRPID